VKVQLEITLPMAEALVLEGFMITLREGMEAFLIVGLSIAFLRKSGRRGLESAIHWGIATAVMVCAAAGILLYQVAFNNPHVASRADHQEGY
jgi:high-affinity iron transporter